MSDFAESAQEGAANLPEYSVSELSFALKRTVEDNFGYVRVRGEISGLMVARSGHMYLSLKDDKAVLDSVVWKGTAGRLRFRPILLTSITTMLGLSPLTFFASGQARFLQPMAITVFFGLGVSTFLILIVIPCAYGALEDLLALVRHPLRTTRRVLANRPVHPRGSLEA